MPGRILVVEDSATNRLIVRTRLTQSYYDVVEAETGEDALEMVKDVQPDLIILDIMLPGIDGFEVCRRLKASSDTLHIPVVMLTSLNDWDDRMRGLKVGADDFLTKPVEEVALLSRVASLVRMKVMIDELALRGETSCGLDSSALIAIASATSFPESRVLHVAMPGERALDIKMAIESEIGAQVDHVAGLSAAVAAIDDVPYDAILIETTIEDGDPLRLGSMIRARPETRQAATFLMVQDNQVALAHKALELGFNDFIVGDPDAIELTVRLRTQLRRKNYADTLRETMRTKMLQAVTDPLTGIYNRRYAHLHLEALVEKAHTKGGSLAILMLDLDRFKSVNDCYGHAGGDLVLRDFAERLQANVRAVDLVARMGGEEFMIALPDVTERVAGDVAERIRRAVEAPAFIVSGEGLAANVTVSIGFSVLRAEETGAALLDRADQALYASKTSGRNRVTTAEAA